MPAMISRPTSHIPEQFPPKHNGTASLQPLYGRCTTYSSTGELNDLTPWEYLGKPEHPENSTSGCD